MPDRGTAGGRSYVRVCVIDIPVAPQGRTSDGHVGCRGMSAPPCPPPNRLAGRTSTGPVRRRRSVAVRVRNAVVGRRPVVTERSVCASRAGFPARGNRGIPAFLFLSTRGHIGAELFPTWRVWKRGANEYNVSGPVEETTFTRFRLLRFPASPPADRWPFERLASTRKHAVGRQKQNAPRPPPRNLRGTKRKCFPFANLSFSFGHNSQKHKPR